jgi:hypothetical protein
MMECSEKSHFVKPQICVNVACLEGFFWGCYINIGVMATLAAFSSNLKVSGGHNPDEMVR